MEVVDPIPLPELCAIPFESTECWKKLDAYDIVAHGNVDIALNNAAALRKTEAAYDAVLDAGKMQQELSQIRQEILEEERRANMYNTFMYQGIIALGLLAAIL